jgi:hypothetical protein
MVHNDTFDAHMLCTQIALKKTWGFPSKFINQPRGLWPHYKSAAWDITSKRVLGPPDS